MSLSMKVEKIGPAEAAVLMGANTKNRHLQATIVRRLGRAMQEGQWTLNGEAIKVAESGRLLDGQHRLAAVIESETTIETVVVRGLPDKTQETLDQGDKRAVGDILTMRGESYGLALAATANTCWRMERNGTLFGGQTNAWPTFRDALEYIEANPDIRKSVALSENLRKRGVLRLQPSLAGALHYLMSKAVDGDSATAFWTSLYDGIDLASDSPILVLRQWLLREQSESRRAATVAFKGALIIKAWNAWIEGRPIKQLRWSRGGANREDFPVISSGQS